MKTLTAVVLSVFTMGSAYQNETLLGKYEGEINKLRLAMIDMAVCLVYMIASVSTILAMTYIYGVKFLYVLPLSLVCGFMAYGYLHIIKLERRLKDDKDFRSA